MKTAVSIPDNLFKEAERAAKRLRVSRSGLIQLAVRQYLQTHDTDSITSRLNDVYAENENSLDIQLRKMQRYSLKKDPW
jgi:metal-responsive CopG/Arc/MetJ family transcriptional regulator